MLDIGDIVTFRDEPHTYEISRISLMDGQTLYKGFDWDRVVPTELASESEFTLVEPTTKSYRGKHRVGDRVLVSRYKTKGGLGPVVDCEQPKQGVIISRYALVDNTCIHIVRFEDDTKGLVHVGDMTHPTAYTLF